MENANFDEFDFNLDDVLAQAAPEVIPAEPEEESTSESGLPYIRFIQAGTNLNGHTLRPLGHAAIEINSTDTRWDGVLFKNPVFMVVDKLMDFVRTDRNGRGKYTTARSMWGFDPETGKGLDDKKPPVCKSLDGYAPLERHIGEIHRFPKNHETRAGLPVVIGYENVYDASGNPIDAVPIADPNQICAKCPFAQWSSYNAIQNGKSVKINVKPMCQEVPRVVVWFPPQDARRLTGNDEAPYEKITWQGGLAILQGAPPSIAIAMNGADKGKLLNDPRDLPELLGFVRQSPEDVELTIAKSNLKQHMFDRVVGFKKTEKAKELVEADEAAFANDDLKFAVVKMPAFPYAPNSIPEYVGWDALNGMKYLTFELVQNTYQSNPYIPRFDLADRAPTKEEYGRFLMAKRAYQEANHRNMLMLPDNSTAVQQKLLAGGAPMPALASGGPDSTTVDVEDIHDM